MFKKFIRKLTKGLTKKKKGREIDEFPNRETQMIQPRRHSVSGVSRSSVEVPQLTRSRSSSSHYAYGSPGYGYRGFTSGNHPTDVHDIAWDLMKKRNVPGLAEAHKLELKAIREGQLAEEAREKAKSLWERAFTANSEEEEDAFTELATKQDEKVVFHERNKAKLKQKINP